jgi:lipid-binding SYLF domain-containing protein
MSSPRLKSVFSAVIALALAAGPAFARTASRGAPSEEQALVNDARATFARFRDDPDLTTFLENEREARAVLIIPKAVRAGLILGGSGGPGVVLARRGTSWSGPSFYRLGTASLGLQIGVDVSEIVVFVRTQRGLDVLLSPSMKMGLDASIAAGPVGAGAGRAAHPTADFVYYSRSKGFYGGVSLEGAAIRPDEEANRAYYGRLASPREVLVEGTFRNVGSKALVASLSPPRIPQGTVRVY